MNYRIINTLSIDISLGAVAVAYFFYLVFGISPDGITLLILGLCVWMIYTIDHLLDARKISGQAITYRHQFHQQYYSVLTWLTLGAGIITAVLVILHLDLQLLYAGLIVGFLSFIYLLSQRYLVLMKEGIGALLYTIGILIPVATNTTFTFSTGVLMLMLQFFLVVFMNLILFSTFDRDKDEKHQQHSIATSLGVYTTNRLIWIFFSGSVLVCGINVFVIGEFINASIVILCMVLVLGMIQLRQNFFLTSDRYRYAGDAIFFIPLLYAWLG